LDVRLAGERVEKRLNESRLPRCIYIDLLGRRRTGSNGKQGGHSDEGCAQSGKGNTHEIQTPFLVVMAARHFILNESYYQVAFAASPHRTTLLNRYGSISLYLKYKFSPECMLSPVKKARAPKSWPHSGPRERPIEGEWWSQAESNRRPLQCDCSALPTELWPPEIRDMGPPGRLAVTRRTFYPGRAANARQIRHAAVCFAPLAQTLFFQPEHHQHGALQGVIIVVGYQINQGFAVIAFTDKEAFHVVDVIGKGQG